MNWLVLIVIFYLAFNLVLGYKKGIADMIFSLITWVLTVVLAIAISPVFANVITDYTPFDQFIFDGARGRISDVIADANISEGNEQLLQSLGINIPTNLINAISSNQDVLGEIMEDSGLYDQLAMEITKLAILGASFIIVVVLSKILLSIIGKKLKLINKIPIVGQVNKVAGGAAGLGKSCLIVWIFFAVIALDSTGVLFGGIIKNKYDSPFLLFMYDNNPLIPVLMFFAS